MDVKTTNSIGSAPEDLRIIDMDSPLYHYARVISNTRFGHMPKYIAYCEHAEHVQWCLTYCRDHGLDFRIRSGGHQHEGMCSGNGVMIIDLSKMDSIEYIGDEEAWIPVGKQLGKVYEELEARSQIIPGGGCQSVNVGGLTQGGGWGLSIRKLGMTCDSITECEMVLASGEIVYPSHKELSDLFWAIKGSGGGNFGVITKFKFKLASLVPVMTSFALLWQKPDDVKLVLKRWAHLHANLDELDPALSTACGMMVANPENVLLPDGHLSAVHSRMGGQFYGSKADLLDLLRKYFGSLIPDEKDFVQLAETRYEIPAGKRSKSDKEGASLLAHHQAKVADFINPTSTMDHFDYKTSSCGDRGYKVLPEAPTSTCDRPHPHKVTSGFPKAKNNQEHDTLIDSIYEYLGRTCYYSDVSQYMSFHCLGGAVTQHPESRVFAFYEKPYMLQIQCWWDDAGNAFTNETRNKVYVKWVEDFRKHLLPQIEGAFINFIDQSLVDDPHTPEGRLELLAIYYGEKHLNTLRVLKARYDEGNFFNFEMSIPPWPPL
ncbi:FAD-binding protein [Aureisphaera galaxeae]|uniref:FAD-dependent oxidoreductase n=1 Tax=Aureisphaera galaxeae TaxID=1538023 RepID=UPI00234FD0B6|nr:FAD-binding protein [Aureisphaera galaxeae]MDC8004306.1 FAD-binding protein [Aureisphaera galaxeae]